MSGLKEKIEVLEHKYCLETLDELEQQLKEYGRLCIMKSNIEFTLENLKNVKSKTHLHHFCDDENPYDDCKALDVKIETYSLILKHYNCDFN